MWWWRKKEAPPSKDDLATALRPLVDRVEAVERAHRRLEDEWAEAQDTLKARLDKYRKRLEREPEPESAPELAPESHGMRRTGGLAPIVPLNRAAQMQALKRGGKWPL